jgi:hypothetical protein
MRPDRRLSLGTTRKALRCNASPIETSCDLLRANVVDYRKEIVVALYADCAAHSGYDNFHRTQAQPEWCP